MFLMPIGDADPTMKIYEILFEKHKTTMYYAAMNILQDSQLAEDAIQQAFERMIRYRVGEKIQDPYCNKTRYFLVTIVKNVCLTLRTQLSSKEIAATTEDFDSLFISPEPTPLDFVLSEELLQHIQTAVRTLEPIYMDVLILSRVYGYSDQELAGMLGISHNNVRIRLHRAKKLLMDILKKGGIIDETR